MHCSPCFWARSGPTHPDFQKQKAFPLSFPFLAPRQNRLLAGTAEGHGRGRATAFWARWLFFRGAERHIFGAVEHG